MSRYDSIYAMLLRPHHWFVSHPRNGHRPHLLRVEGWMVSILFFLGFSWFVTQNAWLQQQVLGSNTDITIENLLTTINEKRSSERLSPLQLNDTLNAAAAAKAEHMMANDYWSHNAPDGTTPWSFIRNAGYRYSVAGENLARNFTSTESMVSAWMESPSHRRNILQGEYQETGLAIREGKMNGRDTILVVEMFGRPSSPLTQVLAPNAAPQPKERLRTQDKTPSDRVLAAESRLSITPFRAVQFGALSLLSFLIVILAADMVLTDVKHRTRYGKNLAHVLALVIIVLAALLARTGQLAGGA